MADRNFYEAGVGNEVTTTNMEKLARDTFILDVGAGTGATVKYLILPRDCFLIAAYMVISGDPGASGAACSVKQGSTTYATNTFANGSSAGDTATVNMNGKFFPAGTVLNLNKGVTTSSANCTFTILVATKDA